MAQQAEFLPFERKQLNLMPRTCAVVLFFKIIVVAYAWNPLAVELKVDKSLGLPGQPAQPNSFWPMNDPVLKEQIKTKVDIP